MPEVEVNDRRTHRRFSLHLPLQVRLTAADEAVETATRDISARGIYFALPQDLRPGADMECVLTLPPEICQGNSILVRCLGRVVRIEAEQHGRTGVAASIDRYEFLRAGETEMLVE